MTTIRRLLARLRPAPGPVRPFPRDCAELPCGCRGAWDGRVDPGTAGVREVALSRDGEDLVITRAER